MTRTKTLLLAATPLIALTAGCATTPAIGAAAEDAFIANLRAYCGKAFEGRVVTTDAADNDMRSARLVMHVRECSDDVIRIPFHVGADRSRTWVITRTAEGVRLKHDHRHEDGSEDALTQYGGDSAAPGTATRQDFPVDQFSKDMFQRGGIPQSMTNVWTVEIIPGRTYAYQLQRPNRLLRVEFDLTRPVAPPPPPWGSR